MPSREQDVQQIHRKRYIGNGKVKFIEDILIFTIIIPNQYACVDIVCIVFMEGRDQKFDPSSIRSQFLHVFIIVHLEVINSQDTWR